MVHQSADTSCLTSSQLVKRAAGDMKSSCTSPRGILVRSSDQRRKARPTVAFNHEPSVIGYGDDVEDVSDDEDETVSSSCSADADFSDSTLSEEERRTINLTKRNTDFNSINSNLLGTTRTLADWVDEQDQTTERSALTGRHKKFTPVVSIAPFGGCRTANSAKVNLVAPMKNGEVVTEKQVHTEMVEKQTPLNKPKMSGKVTRIDEDKVCVDKVKADNASTKPASQNVGESVSVEKITSVPSDTNKNTPASKHQACLSNKNTPASKHQACLSNPIDTRKSESSTCNRPQHKVDSKTDEAENKRNQELTDTISKRVSNETNEKSKKSGLSSGSFDSLSTSRLTPVSREGLKSNKPDVISGSKGLSPALLSVLDRNGRNKFSGSESKPVGSAIFSSKVEDKTSSSVVPQNLSTENSSMHVGNDEDTTAPAGTTSAAAKNKTRSGLTPLCLNASKNVSRTSFLSTMTDQAELDCNESNRKVASAASGTAARDLGVSSENDTNTRLPSPETSDKSADRTRRVEHITMVPRDKPLVAVKPPSLHKLVSSSGSDGSPTPEECGSPSSANSDQTQAAKFKNIKSVRSPTVELIHEPRDDYTESGTGVLVEVKNEALDPSARLSKLVENVTRGQDDSKPRNNLTISLSNTNQNENSTKAEKLMKRELDLEKLREDLGKFQVENPQSAKPRVDDGQVPVRPNRTPRKNIANDTSANRCISPDKEVTARRTEDVQQREYPSVSSKQHEQILVHSESHQSSAESVKEVAGGGSSLQDEIAQLISDTFSKPVCRMRSDSPSSSDGARDTCSALSYKSFDEQSATSAAQLERKSSLEPADNESGDNNDTASDLPPSMSMRRSSISPDCLRRSAVSGAASRVAGMRRRSPRAKASHNARSQSVPRLVALITSSDSAAAAAPAGPGVKRVSSSGSHGTNSDPARGERRSRRDDMKRSGGGGRLLIKKLLKLGKDDKKREKTGAEIRYKPQIIHPLDLAPVDKVEVFVRTEEEKRRDAEERERKKALLIAEGTKVFDSPSYSKMYTRNRRRKESDAGGVNLLGYNSEGRPRPPPPPRRTSSIESAGVAGADGVARAISTDCTVDVHRASVAGCSETAAGDGGVRPERAGSLRDSRCTPSATRITNQHQRDNVLCHQTSFDSSGPASLPVFSVGSNNSDTSCLHHTGTQKDEHSTGQRETAEDDNYSSVAASNLHALQQVLGQMRACREALSPALRYLVSLTGSSASACSLSTTATPAVPMASTLCLAQFQLPPPPSSSAATGWQQLGAAHWLVAASFRRQRVMLLLARAGSTPPGVSSSQCPLLAPAGLLTAPPLLWFCDRVQPCLPAVTFVASSFAAPSSCRRTASVDSLGGIGRGSVVVWVLAPLAARSLQPLSEVIARWPTVSSLQHERHVFLLLLQVVSLLIEQRHMLPACVSLAHFFVIPGGGEDGCRVVALADHSPSPPPHSPAHQLSACQLALVVLLRVLGVRDAMARVAEGRGVAVPSHVTTLNTCELLTSLLQQERECNLASVQAVLQAELWGPACCHDAGRLQRWLAVHRAAMLSQLLSRRPTGGTTSPLSLEQHLHAHFLATTSVDQLMHALQLISI